MKKIFLCALVSMISLPSISSEYVSIINSDSKYVSVPYEEKQPIETKPIVVERTRTATGGYTIWSDGYIEQWGRKSAGEDQVVFPISFTDVNSISFVIQEYAIGDQSSRQPQTVPTLTGIYGFNRSDMVGTWMVEGY